MYQIVSVPQFDRQLKKIVKNKIKLKESVFDTIRVLTVDPFTSILRSHKVQTKSGKNSYSSRVTGDIRLIWDFDYENRGIIELLDIGGHTGQNKVYK